MDEQLLRHAPRFKGRFCAYINPFKDCLTTKTLDHIIDLFLQGKLSCFVIAPLPYIPGTLRLPDGALDKGDVLIGDYEANTQEVREHFYNDARKCWIRLRRQDNLPELGPKVADIAEGLQKIQELCINAQLVIEQQKNSEKKKRRGAGERNDHVEEAYLALCPNGSRKNRPAIELCRQVNKLHDDKYWEMKPDNVMKSQPWKDCRPKKK